jgi:tetratricopeptide (TPR) repeat protein
MSSRTNSTAWTALTAVLVLLCSLAAAQTKKSAAKSNPPSNSQLSAIQKQFAQGDVQGAETATWDLLSANPNDKQAMTLLAMIRGKQQRYPEAESLLRRVVQLDPKSAAPHLSLADILLVQQKSDDAVQEYEEAQRLEPANYEIKTGLAKIFLLKGEFEKALSTLNQVPPAHLPPDGIPLKVASLLGMGHKTEGIALAGAAPKSLPMAMALAEVFLQAGLPDQALRTLKSAAPSAKGNPAQFYYLEGQALLGVGQPDKAEASLRKGSTLDPKSVEILIALAESSAMQNKHDDSVAFLQKARELMPSSVPVLHHLVIEAEAAGQNAVALGAARELVQQSPDDLDNIFLASAAMLQAHDSIGAMGVLKDYTTKRPTDAKGWLALGMAHLIQKNYPQAREALERSAQIEPNQTETEYQLGLVSDAESKQEEAIQHLERVLQLQPSHAKAWGKLGALYLQRGDLARAEQALQKSAAADSGNPDTEYKLAMVLGKMGKSDEARQHMRRFQELKNAGRAASSGDKPEAR